MIDVIKAILRKLGIKLEDVRIERIVLDYGSGRVIPTNDWIMVFVYKEFKIAIELNKVGSEESWVSLVRYYDGDMVDLHRVEVIDTTPQELHGIINDFIHKDIIERRWNEMKLKIDSRIKLTKEQLIEVENLIMFEPDMVWNYNENARKKLLRKYFVQVDDEYVRQYLVQLDGEYAIYKYTVNFTMGIIRLVEVYVNDNSESNERKEEK